MIRVQGTNFNLWAAQLRIDYPTDNIPIPLSQKDWKNWATAVAQSNNFNKAGVPAPLNEKNWNEWANKAQAIMTNTEN